MKNYTCIILFALFATLLTTNAQKKTATIYNMDFNSGLDDFAPVLLKNGRVMTYTTQNSNGQQLATMLERNSSGWGVKDENLNLVNASTHSGGVAITPDAQYMIFAAYEHDEAETMGRTDLYSAKKNNGKWTELTNLGSAVNSSYWDSQPALSADGRTLYFISNRSGNMDIFSSKLGKTNEWGAASPVTELNSAADEASVVIAPDGKTIFFASKRAGGFGGFDLYTAKLSNGKFSSPSNLKEPINSSGDEYYYSPVANSDQAYFSSNRTGGKGELDIYLATPNPFPSEPVVTVSGTVANSITKELLGADITITDLKTGTQVASFRSDDQTGEYFVTLAQGRVYSVTTSKNGYIFLSEKYEVPPTEEGRNLEKNILIQPIKDGSIQLLVFFDYDKIDLTSESIPELERVVELMKENPMMSLRFEGHTDQQGTDDYNQTLSEQRAVAVKNYIISAGINQERMETVGFGKKKPVDSGRTEDAMAKNRRVEMRVLRQ